MAKATDYSKVPKTGKPGISATSDSTTVFNAIKAKGYSAPEAQKVKDRIDR